jgi:anaerobic ribonucleoside-triphosphate reductase activating protein
VDTWDPSGGKTLDIETLVPELVSLVIEHELTGLTITGGEPTEQGEALADVVKRFHSFLDRHHFESFDVLMFTGRSAEEAQRVAPALWSLLDAAVCGPYRPDLPGSEPLVTSANQELLVLTASAQACYSSQCCPQSDQQSFKQHKRSLQAHVENGTLTLIGLPNPGDLTQLEKALERRGVAIGGRSWMK